MDWYFDPADYPVGSNVYVRGGSHWQPTVTRYIVTRITPSGQVVAKRKYPNGETDEVRLNKRGRVIGSGGSYSRDAVDEARALEINAEMRARHTWGKIAKHAELVEMAARRHSREAFDSAMADLVVAAAELQAETPNA